MLSLLTVSDGNNISLVRTMNTSFNCFSISALETDSFLVSTFDHPQPIRAITVQGQEGDLQNANFPSTVYTLEGNKSTYITSTKTAIISDRKDDAIYMCSIENGHMKKIKDSAIREPRGVVGGPDGSVFVCCHVTHSVVRLSPRGDVLFTHDVRMKGPYAISVSRDGTRLVVSNNRVKYGKIKLFKIMG